VSLVDPTEEEVTVTISLDGYQWVFVVESWEETRSFGERLVNITGRSLTVLLSDPFSLERDYVETNTRLMAQLATNEVPIDWTLDWNTSDWTVPAGAWSYQGLTPIQAIARLAEAAGAIVVPSTDSRLVTVQPRYPVMPWDYWGAIPAHTIPENTLSNLQTRCSPQSGINAVYVHGAETGGILARVLLFGSAGDALCKTQMEPLITHTTGARALGARLIAAAQQQSIVRSFTMPVDDGTYFPLMQVGQLLQVALEPLQRSTVSAVSVVITNNKGAISVRQTITLGEDSRNQWKRFKSMVAAQPTVVGLVTDVHVDGTISVSLYGGGTMRVRGTALVGQNVYITGGVVQGVAPSLPYYSLPI